MSAAVEQRRAPARRRPADFVVTQYVRLAYRPGYVEALPVGLAHAKTYGTTRTRCGLEASTWHLLWDQRFPTLVGDSCPRCIDLQLEEARLERLARSSVRGEAR